MNIGRALKGSRSRGLAAIGIGAATVGADLLLIHAERGLDPVPRLAVAAVGVFLLYLLAGRDRATIGFTFTPEGGWPLWRKRLVVFAAWSTALFLVALAGWFASGERLPIPPMPPEFIPRRFLWMCIETPLFEEAIYRVAIVVPIVAFTYGRWAILVSGGVFAWLHVLYGSPSPENLVLGFPLAWLYVRSGTLVLPIALHAAINFLAITVQFGYWCVS